MNKCNATVKWIKQKQMQWSSKMKIDENENVIARVRAVCVYAACDYYHNSWARCCRSICLLVWVWVGVYSTVDKINSDNDAEHLSDWKYLTKPRHATHIRIRLRIYVSWLMRDMCACLSYRWCSYDGGGEWRFVHVPAKSKSITRTHPGHVTHYYCCVHPASRMYVMFVQNVWALQSAWSI